MVLTMNTSGDRRGHPRLDAQRLSGMSGRVRPGHVVRVMNLSAGGALIETARRLVPGGIADLQLESGEWRHSTRARVVRSYVSRVFPDAMLFHSAVTFERMLPWLSALPNETDLASRGVRGLEQCS